MPFTDQQRLAAAAYLAWFKGASRDHTESDLRCCLAWCTEHGLDPLTARRPHLKLYIRWMQEIRRLQAIDRLAAVLDHRRVLPDLHHRWPAGALTRRARPAALSTAGITNAGVHPPAVRGPAERGPGLIERVRLRAGSHARAARFADLRSQRSQHRRPRRRTRPPSAAGVRQRHQGRLDPAPASSRPRPRPRDRHPYQRPDPAQQPRRPDGPPLGHPPPAAPG